MVSPLKEVKNAKAFPKIRMLNDTESRSANLCITILKKPRGLGTDLPRFFGPRLA